MGLCGQKEPTRTLIGLFGLCCVFSCSTWYTQLVERKIFSFSLTLDKFRFCENHFQCTFSSYCNSALYCILYYKLKKRLLTLWLYTEYTHCLITHLTTVYSYSCATTVNGLNAMLNCNSIPAGVTAKTPQWES